MESHLRDDAEIQPLYKSFTDLEVEVVANYDQILSTLNGFMDRITASNTWNEDVNRLQNYSYAGFKPMEMMQEMIAKGNAAVPVRPLC